MNISAFLKTIEDLGITQLGIPCLTESIQPHLFSILQWALEGKSEEGRQLWFCASNAKELMDSFPPTMRGRVLAIHVEKIEAIFKRGPFDALVLPKHGFLYSDPNLLLSSFWKNRGQYNPFSSEFDSSLQLWIWKSTRKPLKLFGIDHHHAVLWDAKQILKPLGIQLDFYWLSDGRPPVNEAIPASVPGFISSWDIYKRSPTESLSPEFVKWFQDKSYQGIVTSHSLVTAYRLRELGLPHAHINSTRFGNEWIQRPDDHTLLVNTLEELFHKKRLQILHNNFGDALYLHQYFPSVLPQQEIVIPSLCESLLRLRVKTPTSRKFLIWDTRQTLLREDGSPFMKALYQKGKEVLGDALESQAILLSQQQSFLPEGYLDNYTAIIHIPYNVSTMSIREQTRSNIPVWIPSPSLLETLWKDIKEPNELSWTVFAPGSEVTASPLDKAHHEQSVKKWIKSADFYDEERMSCILPFHSIDDLLSKIKTTDYQEIMDKAEANQQKQREEIFFSYEQVFREWC